MATHSSILAWRILWTEEPGGLQSTGSQRVWYDWATSLSLLIYKFYFLLVWLLDHIVILLLIFGGNSLLFSIMAVPDYTSSNSAQMFPYSTYLPTFFFWFLIITILTGGSSILLWFWFAFPWWFVMLNIFFGYLYVFFGKKKAYSSPLPIFIFWLDVLLSLYMFWILTLCQIYGLQIFSSKKRLTLDKFIII